jgi:hypothetical protein
MAHTLQISDLKRELHNLQERFTSLSPDSLFVLWFLQAYATGDGEDPSTALTGGSGDKDADAILINDEARAVVLVQAKLRDKIMAKAENRHEVTAFAELAHALAGDAAGFRTRLVGAAPQAAERLGKARERVQKRGYRVLLYFVTTGRFTPSVKEEAEKIVRRARQDFVLDLIDGARVLRILDDFLSGVAPPVPSLDLEVETGHGVRTSPPLQRYDDRIDIESWVFTMTAKAVADLYGQTDSRLFARNIRGFLGKSDINGGMIETLEDHPEYFWYFNNGITIICDGAEMVTRQGRPVVRVHNPQIINGQQTTRVLHATVKRASRASVIVRVIRVAREGSQSGMDFDTLVSQIVATTNWQNAIRQSDLMANDRRQVDLERQLRTLGYLYVRKRQSKGEAQRIAGTRVRRMIKKEELAQAVAACDLDPVLARLGKERLFEKDRYSQVFPTGDPYYYLHRYWLSREVGFMARGYPERAYAKWLVVHFVWQRLSPLLSNRTAREAVLRAHERNDGVSDLSDAIARVFVAALTFYRSRRGLGQKAIDVSSFFQRRGLHHQFARFWGRSANPSRGSFARHWKRFEQTIREASTTSSVS